MVCWQWPSRVRNLKSTNVSANMFSVEKSGWFHASVATAKLTDFKVEGLGRVRRVDLLTCFDQERVQMKALQMFCLE